MNSIRQKKHPLQPLKSIMGVNPGGLGVVTPRFWSGGLWGRRGVVKYYYILSCTGNMFESLDF